MQNGNKMKGYILSIEINKDDNISKKYLIKKTSLFGEVWYNKRGGGRMDLNRKNIQKILLIIFLSILFFLALQNIKEIYDILNKIVKLFAPFIIGLCMAFALNILLKSLEEKVKFPSHKTKFQFLKKYRRGIFILLTLGIVVGVIMIFMFLIVPEIKRATGILVENFPQYFEQMQSWFDKQLNTLNVSTESIKMPDLDWNKVEDQVINFLQNSTFNFLSTTVGVTTSIFSWIFNIVLGFIFSLYVLFNKEKLANQVKRTLYAFLPKYLADEVISISSLSYRIFSNFIIGQFLEAAVIGILCFLGMTIFSMPYALTISSLVGFTALIPVFGAFIGTAVGVFLILVVDPMKALWFVIFILVLQQLEGNFIYPRVVGTSVGLPGMWVLVAVTLGGSTFGVIGMLISVPLCSILYCLLKESVSKRLKGKKKISGG